MSTTDHATPAPDQAVDEPASEYGLSALVIPAILLALAVFLTVGTVTMKLPPSVQVPGPTFFPIIVIVLLVVMAVLSTVQILRSRRLSRHLAQELNLDRGSGLDDIDASGTATIADGPSLDADGDVVTEIPPDVPPGRAPWPAAMFSDWRALGTVLGALVLFIVLLRPAGWIIAAAVLFWGVSYALGSRRPVFDLSVALVMSSVIQLIFGTALGLNLPAGFLEGVL